MKEKKFADFAKELTIEDIKAELFKMQDMKYKEFQQRLMPTSEPETVIGVRTPVLREYAKRIQNDAEKFLSDLPHQYYEENNLHAFLVEKEKDFDKCIEKLNEFLPYVDNWATCDCMKPKVLKKYPDKLLRQIKIWIRSDRVYTVRYAVNLLMSFYLDESFDKKYLQMVASIKSDEYYINMMLAWYFATALAKQWDSTVVYLQENRLSVWVHNKTIQKAVESFRITAGQKKYLKGLKR